MSSLQLKNIARDVKFREIKLVDAYIKEVILLEKKFYHNRFELYFLIEDTDKLNQGDKKILSSVDFYRLYIKRYPKNSPSTPTLAIL